MKPHRPDYSGIMRTLKILHAALIFMPIAFGAVAAYINLTEPIGDPEGMEIMLYLPPLCLLIALPLSSFLFKNTIKQAQLETKDLKQKLMTFQTAHLIRMSLFEVAGLMAAVITLVTANNFNMVILIVVAGMFFFLTPTPSRIALDLDLTTEERELLEE